LNMDSWDNMPCENVLLAMDITLDWVLMEGQASEVGIE
jgi:hypothetical protein